MKKNYKTSIIIDEKKVIPSDIFESNTSRYILMDIVEENGKTMLEIMALSGVYISKTFTIDYKTFSSFSLSDFEEWIDTYLSN